jgi:signal transduction protein with GAF and PtsI domain
MAHRLHGLGVSTGEVSRPLARLSSPPVLPPTDVVVSDAELEVARATAALAAVADELDRRAATVNGAARDVLAAQAMIARDPVLDDGVCARVRTGRDAPSTGPRARPITRASARTTSRNTRSPPTASPESSQTCSTPGNRPCSA